ncbi:uncharacterized protein LOC120110315 [Phoenix dactylifera]|uniref:Uncharacterized protein LOC120110315 n=1 Tax=Phoenix dactylifera TaxID=42345 RepID=A0A8B9ACL8_PHODC|nr:uncharacterized protein LOC120110315 [Phoenix dactylifera]
MRIRRKTLFGPARAPITYYLPEAPPSRSVALAPSPSVDRHHRTTGTMSSDSQPKSQSPEREPFDSPQPLELQPLSSCHPDGVPSNYEPNPSPALPQGLELALVAPDAPALEVAPLNEKPRRRASRRRAEWTPPEGMQTIVLERKSGKSKGNKDTYYTLPGVSTKFRSIPEVQRHLEKKPARIWRKLPKNSGTRPSQPAEAAGSSSNPLVDPQPATESSPEEPKEQTNDEEQAEGPKSRPKVCVQRNLFKRSRRHKRKNL